MLHISEESQKALQRLGKGSLAELLKQSSELRANINKSSASIANAMDRTVELRLLEDRAAQLMTRSSDTTNVKGRKNK